MTKIRYLHLGILAVLVAGLFSSSPAFAQSATWAPGCGADGTLNAIFCSLSTEFRFIPKALALFAYAGGVILAFIALLNLRAYGDDPSQTPLRDIVMKFLLGAILISLPLGMQVIVKTVTGKGLADQNIQDTAIDRPCLARGSSLDPTLNNASNAGCN